MAILQDLISQIEDKALRDRILQETNKLFKQKKFGLVFEEHLPECTPLYEIPVRVGSNVALKTGYVKDIYTVINIDGDNVTCYNKEVKEEKIFNIDELVVIAQFGEPIYPYLQQIDMCCNAPDSDLWHTLIEADNYHALQLLEYLYAGKVDCIYIDPPYNNGATDWKYNNDYVDKNDSYKHSKWLSMMQKRLKLAKKMLNPQGSLLICTIDDKEYLHLGCLLEELFPDARIQMISDVINPKGTMQRKKMPRTDEYLYFVWLGNAEPIEQQYGLEWLIGDIDNTNRNRYRWVTFIRTAQNVSRRKTPTMFYPIYIDSNGTKITRVGESLPLDVDYKTIKPGKNEKVLFPINSKGREVIWHLTQESLKTIYKKGYIKLNTNKKGTSISYLPSGMQEKLECGDIHIKGYDKNGAVIFDASEFSPSFLPGTQWRIKRHDATEHGTKLLQKIIGNRFPYPKSLYSVKDALNFYLSQKKDALVVDFFSGSGTTLHAINLLNAEDSGKRRCIMITNNEVAKEEAELLSEQGYHPGDAEWEQYGIARYVTWPRTICSIEGHDIDNNPLQGNYIGLDIPMANGFKSNCAYFKLGFLDKTSIALGKQFKNLLSVLWMKAGAYGECPILESDKEPDMLILPKNRFAVLTNETMYSDFTKQINNNLGIRTLFFVTDSENSFKEMIKGFEDRQVYQLYRDYLDNFRINVRG